MLEKRGLSTIVATLIIILLTLVSVGIIWTVIKNVVQSGAEQVELGQFTLDLEIKAAQIQNGDVTVVIVRRNPGQGDFVGMNFIFSDGQNSEIIRENVSLKEGDQKSFTFRLTKISTVNLKTVSVVPIFKMESGKESTGSIADTFDVPANKSLATGGVVQGNFAALGFAGAGKIQYTVSSNPGIYPEFKNVIVDPVDVHVGDNQTFTATVYSPNGIASVTTKTQLDNESLVLPLVKISEDAGTSTWSATWTVYDTHIEIYRTTFIATDNIGNKNNVTLTWTDACTDQFTHNAVSNILVDCTVTSLDGADTSNIIIASGTNLILSSGGTVAYTPGYSVTKSGSGKILFSGGSLTKQYLFYADSDGDTYSSNNTYSVGTSASASGKVRAKDAVGTSDCNDTFSSNLGNGCGLVNYVSNATQCTNAGGTVFSDGGDDRCKFNSASCDPGFDPYNSWSTTQSVTCNGGLALPNAFAGTFNNALNVPCPAANCSTGSHVFSNTATETCVYLDAWADFHCPNPDTPLCVATVRARGCSATLYKEHTSASCISAGGTVVASGSNGLCKFNSVSCPAGWTQYNSWTTTTPVTCNGTLALPNPFVGIFTNPLNVPCPATSCTTSSHTFSDNSTIETCVYLDAWADFHCPNPTTPLCYATVTQVGCY